MDINFVCSLHCVATRNNPSLVPGTDDMLWHCRQEYGHGRKRVAAREATVNVSLEKVQTTHLLAFPAGAGASSISSVGLTVGYMGLWEGDAERGEGPVCTRCPCIRGKGKHVTLQQRLPECALIGPLPTDMNAASGSTMVTILETGFISRAQQPLHTWYATLSTFSMMGCAICGRPCGSEPECCGDAVGEPCSV